jgi:SPP1 gp7 family putative phage head morphogenesis protein
MATIDLVQLVQQQRAMRNANRTRPRRRLSRVQPKQVKPPRPSRAVEVRYHRQLDELVDRYTAAVNTQLIPLLKQLEPQYANMPATSDSFRDVVTSGAVMMAIERMIRELARNTTANLDAEAQWMAGTMVDGSDYLTTDQLKTAIQSAYGVDIGPILRAQNIQGPLTVARNINVNLIKTIAPQYFDQVQNTVFIALQQGQRWESIVEDIQHIGDVSYSRAKLIARDQTSKTNGAINEARQRDLGIDSYRWITSNDERVRETHAAHEGNIYRWDDPPEDTGHPGFDYNCRCLAAPIIGEEGDEGYYGGD